jgi:hypothetical protein
MATLQAVVKAIQSEVGALSGIRAAPEYMPEAPNVFPFAQAFVESGSYIQRQGTMVGTHSVVVAVHVARKDLPRDIEKAMEYAKSVPNAIIDAMRKSNLGSTVSHFGNITYTFGPLQWGDVGTLGFRFVVEEIRTEDAIS